MTIIADEVLSFPPPGLLIKRFCSDYGVSETEARERFDETKKFLILAASNITDKYSPSKSVDEMWHSFILHSKDYFSFCQELNCFIHHQPSSQPSPENYLRTRRDLASMFGKLNSRYWSEQDADCSSCDCCPLQ